MRSKYSIREGGEIGQLLFRVHRITGSEHPRIGFLGIGQSRFSMSRPVPSRGGNIEIGANRASSDKPVQFPRRHVSTTRPARFYVAIFVRYSSDLDESYTSVCTRVRSRTKVFRAHVVRRRESVEEKKERRKAKRNGGDPDRASASSPFVPVITPTKYIPIV